MTARKFISAVAALLLVSTTTFASIDMPSDADRDRDREARADRNERESDLYEQGSDQLDDHAWKNAIRTFDQVVALHGAHADGALYWKAYAQNKLGLRTEALATLVDMRANYPKTRWSEDAKALELEIRQSAGQQVAPEHVDDEDLKLMALNGLLAGDPDRAIPMLETILNGNASRKVKDRALFVLSQSRQSKAMDILGRIARGQSNPDLQARAVRYLGIVGGEESRRVLADVYTQTADVATKKSIIRAYMVGGDRTRLMQIARSEPSVDLRGEAIRQLGVTGGRSELADLYANEQSVPLRRDIIRAMFIGGNAEKLAEIARGEKVPELRLEAIRSLGLMGGARTGDFLLQMYQNDSSRDVREAVIKGLFVQNNAKALVGLARKEKDPELKREIVSKLSIMQSKDAADYLIEVLNQ